MGKRSRIGLVYLFDRSWLGGLYYAQNLVSALGKLDDSQKPDIDVYCYDEVAFIELKDSTHYPFLHLNVIHQFQWKRKLKNILYLLSKKAAHNINLFKILPEDEVIFPYNWGSEVTKLIHWLPDFQDKYFPQYFSKYNLIRREQSIIQTCKRGIPIVFSSNDCQNDFRKFYPQFENHKTYVVHFAVNQPDFSDVSISTIKEKFGITKPYLLCANQFWGHKNHMFLFRAYKKALDNGLDCQLVCTGSLDGSKDPQYKEQIKNYIQVNGLEKKILLLGIIDKKELLCLMKHSHAVVQPSLFEGWNTTVEDCKCMNKFIFLSNLPVHREQIEQNVCFFDPHDEDELADKLCTVKPTEKMLDYSLNIKSFAEDFYHVIEDVKNANSL